MYPTAGRHKASADICNEHPKITSITPIEPIAYGAVTPDFLVVVNQNVKRHEIRLHFDPEDWTERKDASTKFLLSHFFSGGGMQKYFPETHASSSLVFVFFMGRDYHRSFGG